MRSLHGHFCIWGGLPPQLLQRVGGSVAAVQQVAEVLDSMFTATVPAAVHVEGLLRRRAGVPPAYNAMSMAECYTPLAADELERIADATGRPAAQLLHDHRAAYDTRFAARMHAGVDATNVHVHSGTCQRDTTEFCRLSKPNGLVAATGVVELECEPDVTAKSTRAGGLPKDRVKAREEGVTAPPAGAGMHRDMMVSPLDLADTRLLFWELLRPEVQLTEDVRAALSPESRAQLEALTPHQLEALVAALLKRNGSIVEYNATLTALLGCNTAALILGGREQARGALW